MSEETYLERRATMLQALSTRTWTRELDQTIPGWTRAGPFSRLLPGVFAWVKPDNNPPNRVRSGP